MPKLSRPQLRVLARELGTSHQLLGYYLKNWDRWRMKEYGRQTNAILARATTENRSLTDWELQQYYACNRAHAGIFAHLAFPGELKQIR